MFKLQESEGGQSLDDPNYQELSDLQTQLKNKANSYGYAYVGAFTKDPYSEGEYTRMTGGGSGRALHELAFAILTRVVNGGA